MLAEHFKKNFYYEVQHHSTEKQREVNRHNIAMAEKLGVSLIMGCDSHFIQLGDALERSDFLKSKGIDYPDEGGWLLDYPDGDEAYRRFADQGVLSHSQIMDAISATNVFLEVEEYKSPCFTKAVKMPTLHPDKTQEEKDEIYEKLVWDLWNSEKASIPPDEWPKYEAEVKKEVEIVKATKHADYFLLNHEIVKLGKQRGGMITPSGRGSGVSFYTNKLLGMTDVDRISAKVKMHPERFMSAERILEAGSLADIDLNLADPDIFAQAQSDLMGEGHSCRMIAYTTMRPLAAWKMYSKSQDLGFSVTNEISARLKNWQTACIFAENEEQEPPDIKKYIDRTYLEICKGSEKYLGVVVNFGPHPCSHLVYQGEIREEIGLVRANSQLCCIMDGKWAEEYKFLKNDLLKVSTVELISRSYDRAGIPLPSVKGLLEMCGPESKVWGIFKSGCTMGINQLEQPNAYLRP
jgi:DNA polymerase III alpha subunit